MTQIVAMSRDLKIYFLENRGSVLHVESVYDEAINLIDDSGVMVTLLKNKGDIGPMSFVCEPWESFKELVIGNKVEVEFNGLYFQESNRHLDILEIELYNPFVYYRRIEENPNELLKRYELIKSLLLEEGSLQGIAPVLSEDKSRSNTYATYIEPMLIDFLEALKVSDTKRALSLMESFVGFGPGLTPSTDDFLVGIFLTLYVMQQHTYLRNLSELLNQVGASIKGRSTRVSEEMILHSAKGKVKESYKNVITALFSPRKSNLRQEILRALDEDALSTSDFLTGVYFSKELVLSALSL